MSVLDVFREAQEGVAGGQALLLLADYDGTLTRTVPDPGQAWLARGLRDDLRDLSLSARAHVGVLSGRAVRDLRSRVGLDAVIYAGCHGLEVEGPGLSFRHPAAVTKQLMLNEMGDRLRHGVASIPGVVVEPKGLSLAVHYRHVPESDRERFDTEIDRVLARRDGLRVIGGDEVLEVLPTLGWDKADCALWIRDRLAARTSRALFTVYVGDDATDEVAFAALGKEALTVRVGAGISRARYQLHDVAEVESLVAALAADIRGRGECA